MQRCSTHEFVGSVLKEAWLSTPRNLSKVLGPLKQCCVQIVHLGRIRNEVEADCARMTTDIDEGLSKSSKLKQLNAMDAVKEKETVEGRPTLICPCRHETEMAKQVQVRIGEVQKMMEIDQVRAIWSSGISKFGTLWWSEIVITLTAVRPVFRSFSVTFLRPLRNYLSGLLCSTLDISISLPAGRHSVQNYSM